MNKLFRNRFITYLGILIILTVSIFFLFELGHEDFEDFGISVADAMSGDNNSNFTKADSVIDFVFPKDHGSHDNYKIEWWYFTGNLKDENGNHFGYQFTIFRNALSSDSMKSKNDFATNQLYFAHLGLTDVNNNKHYSFEKFSRGAKGLAFANSNPLEIRVEDWYCKGFYYNDDFKNPEFKIYAKTDEIEIDFDLKPNKNIVFHGNKGLSAKSNEKGNASYYYSFTNLGSSGRIIINEKSYLVKGKSWMDREWSTSALSKNQKGWDWFSLQLDDNSELMFFRLRDTNSNTDFCKGTYIDKNGTYENLDCGKFDFQTKDYVKLDNGKKYPSKWKLLIPSKNLNIEAETQIDDQEMKLSVKYYEGTIKVKAKKNGINLNGFGYVELTGY